MIVLQVLNTKTGNWKVKIIFKKRNITEFTNAFEGGTVCDNSSELNLKVSNKKGSLTCAHTNNT